MVLFSQGWCQNIRDSGAAVRLCLYWTFHITILSALWPGLWWGVGPGRPCRCGSGWVRKCSTAPSLLPNDPSGPRGGTSPLIRAKNTAAVTMNCGPWVIVMEGGRKQLFLPSSLLVTHLSSLSLSFFTLFLSLSLFPHNFFSDWKIFQTYTLTQNKTMNPLHLSQDRNTNDMENSLKPKAQQISFELTVNKTIKTRWRAVGWLALTSASDLG